MNKIVNKHLNETYYEEVLENGLKVVIFEKPDFVTTSAIFATPYGALDYKQVIGKDIEYSVPSGLAHFLEHKLFESDNEDVMVEFSSYGANVNAFTSYSETMYYFSTSSSDISKPLNLLLDFVQNLSISEESVEKEKGIIVQELKMYEQMPDSRLLLETFKSMYQQFPLNQDIGGTEESVNSVYLKQLMDTHKLNYHPSNMMLVIMTPIKKEHLLKLIKNNQGLKTFDTYQPIKRLKYDEPYEVAQKEKDIHMALSNTKTSVGLKMKEISGVKNQIKTEWALRCAFEAHFTSLNENYQVWLDQEIINDFFGYEIDFSKGYGFSMFYNETNNTQVFYDFLFKQLQILKSEGIKESILTQLKKRYYGQAIIGLNHLEDTSISFIRSHFDGINFFESLEIINELTLSDVLEALDRIDLENKSFVRIS